MAKVTIDEQVFTDIADAIRDRNGEVTTYKPREMADAVEDLHNVRVKKWIRPSGWPDYSKVDLTDQEVIYLTYDCTYESACHISVLVSGAYTIKRGSLTNGVFTAVTSTDMTSGSTFQETLPSNEGDYVVYQIIPQEGSHITNFRFVSMTDSDSSIAYYGPLQPCIERYCNVPYHTTAWGGSQTTSASSHITHAMIADTIIGATPNGNIANSYRTDTQGIQYVNIGKCSFENVTNLQYMFYYCYFLQELYLPHDLGTKCTSLLEMFRSCERLVYLDLSGWDTSHVTSFAGMFNGCACLCEIKGIDDFNFLSATNISNMFNTCRVLDKLDTSKWETTTALTTCASMFSSCWNLKFLDLSGLVTNNVTSFASMFYACASLTELDLSGFVISNKTTALNGMFQYCRSLINIIRNKDWDTSNVTTFEGMFSYCLSIKILDISDFNFSKATNIKNMISYMTRLQKVIATINLSALTEVANVGSFAGGSNLFLDDISELVFTNCTYMPYFGYCRSLKSIKIPSSVTTIPNDTFRDCGHLALVDCRDCTVVPALGGANAFILNSNTKQKIVVPNALYDEWVAATNWSNATLVTRIIKASDYEASLT